MTKKEWHECLEEMNSMFPDAHCELVHRNPFDLLIATLLSAQCTDKLVNRVTATLFQKYSTPEDYISVPLEELEQDIRSIGLFRNKAKNIQALSHILIADYGSQVPADRDLLMTLPGVGRKTANVVVSVAFGIPALAVDTHVERVAKRLGLNRWKDTPLQVEETIMKKTPAKTGQRRIIKSFSLGVITANHKILRVIFARCLIVAEKEKNATKKDLSIVKLSQKLTKEHVDPFFLEWQTLTQEISELHRRKDKRVMERMHEGILLYEKLLLHCMDDEQKNALMPLNNEERFAFIASRPGNFAAYRQLDELFSEMRKMIAAKRIQLKRLN